MNCKPQQWATIVKPWPTDPCSVKCTGIPVQVSHLQGAESLGDLLQEVFEGPIWHLVHPLTCPHAREGCHGIRKAPDQCLRPFDPESSPVDEPVVTELVVDVREDASA